MPTHPPTHKEQAQCQTPNTYCTCTVCLPEVEHSRPYKRDFCTGPSRPQPPSERCDAHGLSGSRCRVCGHARCVQSANRAGPPHCRHTATPLLHTKKSTPINNAEATKLKVHIFFTCQLNFCPLSGRVNRCCRSACLRISVNKRGSMKMPPSVAMFTTLQFTDSGGCQLYCHCDDSGFLV